MELVSYFGLTLM